MIRAISIFSISLLASGCMSFNDEMLPRREQLPPPEAVMSIAYKTEDFVASRNGKTDGFLVSPVSGASIGNSLASAMTRRWKKQGHVSAHGTIAKVPNPDLILTMSGSRNEQSDLGVAFLTGLTLDLFPSSWTLEFDVQATLENQKTGQTFNAESKNSTTMWHQIFFLPAFPFALVGSTRCVNDIYDDIYFQLQQQGAFTTETIPAGQAGDQ